MAFVTVLHLSPTEKVVTHHESKVEADWRAKTLRNVGKTAHVYEIEVARTLGLI